MIFSSSSVESDPIDIVLKEAVDFALALELRVVSVELELCES